MGINAEFLSILACPSCKSEVKEQGDKLVCLNPSCLLAFPVRNGIPVMLIEEAEKK
jgi:uncharacterized protein YbaR (Trm112 family)